MNYWAADPDHFNFDKETVRGNFDFYEKYFNYILIFGKFGFPALLGIAGAAIGSSLAEVGIVTVLCGIHLAESG